MHACTGAYPPRSALASKQAPPLHASIHPLRRSNVALEHMQTFAQLRMPCVPRRLFALPGLASDLGLSARHDRLVAHRAHGGRADAGGGVPRMRGTGERPERSCRACLQPAYAAWRGLLGALAGSRSALAGSRWRQQRRTQLLQSMRSNRNKRASPLRGVPSAIQGGKRSLLLTLLSNEL